MAWTKEKVKEICDSNGGGVALDNAVRRFVAGVVVRERERIARKLREAGSGDLADAILDDSDDAAVFQWKPASTGLSDAASD